MSLKKIAKEVASSSPATFGREKTTIDDIIKQYPEGFRIVAVDIISMATDDKDEHGEPIMKPVAAIAIESEPPVYFFGGKQFKAIVESWIEAVGDIEAVNTMLEDEEIRVLAVKISIKNGKTFTSVSILD